MRHRGYFDDPAPDLWADTHYYRAVCAKRRRKEREANDRCLRGFVFVFFAVPGTAFLFHVWLKITL